MFFGPGLSGSDLPAKTVCLTFDDGPGEPWAAGMGPRTLDLAAFLHARQIPATFFVIGEFAAANPEIVKQVAAMNHCIGNHTYNHVRLGDRSGSFAAEQISSTDQILAPHITQSLQCFRPPHGRWSSEVAGELNWTKASHHVGPILWDIDGADWRFWAQARPAEECAAAYIERIQSQGRGIIILHDSSFEPEIRLNNRTFEAARSIVEWLQENGYTFVGLDSLPQVREAMRVSSLVCLRTLDGRYFSSFGGGELRANANRIGPWDPLGVVELDEDATAGRTERRLALRCLSNRYLTIRNEDQAVRVDAPHIDAGAILTVVDLGADRVAIRCTNGRYLASGGDDGETLSASATELSEGTALEMVRPSC